MLDNIFYLTSVDFDDVVTCTGEIRFWSSRYDVVESLYAVLLFVSNGSIKIIAVRKRVYLRETKNCISTTLVYSSREIFMRRQYLYMYPVNLHLKNVLLCTRGTLYLFIQTTVQYWLTYEYLYSVQSACRNKPVKVLWAV